MSEELLVRHCSPTLAGMKTGSLFTCSYEGADEMRDALRRFNRMLGKKGLRLIPLRYRDRRALIYVYRPKKLFFDLQHATACELLRTRGYCTETPERCIVHLIKRLSEGEDFPHEIDCFLGYPPEDVCGFIENKAQGCKCVGCWKVYGDTKAAQMLFAKYRKCTEIYTEQFAKGKSIERLTVAG